MIGDAPDLTDVLCSYRCGRLAEGVLEGEGPLCVPCAEAFIDRAGALELWPELRENLVALQDDFFLRMKGG